MQLVTKVPYLVLLLLLLGGCQRDEPLAVPSQGVILAFGDSLTVGQGAAPNDSYPRVLAQLSGRVVINAGRSGETTEQGLRRLPFVLEDSQPSIMILLEGGNDIIRNISHTRIKKNLRAMIELAHQKGVTVVLIGVPNKNLLLSPASLYSELADSYQLIYDGSILPRLLRSRQFKSDAIHLNQAGYRQLAQQIFQLIQKHRT